MNAFFPDECGIGFAVEARAEGLHAELPGAEVWFWDEGWVLDFISQLAADHRGWTGERTWHTSHLAVRATTRSRGHVTLNGLSIWAEQQEGLSLLGPSGIHATSPSTAVWTRRCCRPSWRRRIPWIRAPPLRQLGQAISRARVEAGKPLLEKLAREIGYSGSMLSRAHRPDRPLINLREI